MTMEAKPSQIRKEVMAEIVVVYRAARDRGDDGWKAVEAAIPGIPSDVVAEAWLQVEDEATETWWSGVERTIDGEIIRNALAKVPADDAR